MTSNGFSAIWAAEAEAGADTGADGSSESADAETGPITSAIEGTQWTREDIELAVELAKGTVLLLTLYYAMTGGSDAL